MAAPPADPISLRRVVHERRTYRRDQSLAVMDDGSGSALRIEVRSHVDARPFGDGRVLEHTAFRDLRLLRDGEDADSRARLRGVDQLMVRSLRDARGVSLEPPRAAGQPRTSPDLHAALLATLRLLRVEFPDRPVVPGDRWEGAPIEWDSPPSHRLTVVLEPAWRLRDYDEVDGEQVARIEWHGTFRIEPFAAMAGTTLEGTGSIEGVTRVRVSDGRPEHTELDLRVSIGPSGAAALRLFQFEAKYEERLRPREERRRTLIPSVRLVEGTRAREQETVNEP